MLKKSLTSDEVIIFDIFIEWRENIQIIFVVFATLLALIFTFVYGALNKLKYDKNLGRILALVYFSFIFSATAFEVYHFYKTY